MKSREAEDLPNATATATAHALHMGYSYTLGSDRFSLRADLEDRQRHLGLTATDYHVGFRWARSFGMPR